MFPLFSLRFLVVALREESVDRNSQDFDEQPTPAQVALREESVDRNSWAPVNDGPDLCRSPRGERG